MPNILLAEIEAALQSGRIRIVDLVQIDFGDAGSPYRFSTDNVPDTISFDGEEYEARIPREGGIGTLHFTVGSDEKTSTFRFTNEGVSPPSFAGLEEAGVELSEGQIKVVRLFSDLTPPNNRYGTWVKPYWHGRVKASAMTRDFWEVEAAWGFLELSRRAGWKFQAGCRHIIGDGFYCPYSVLNGYGRPDPVTSGTVTSATPATLVDNSKDFVALGIEANHVILAYDENDESKLAVGQVQAVATTTLTVDFWRFGAPAPLPASGWKYDVGPEVDLETHDYSVDSCIKAGMFAPADGMPRARLNKHRRRFFGGWTEPKARTSRPLVTLDTGEKGRFDRTPSANRGVVGSFLPLSVGHAVRYAVPAIAFQDEGDFGHFVFPYGYGRCHSLGTVQVAGDPVDNQDLSIEPYRDSLVLHGFELPNPADATAGNDTSLIGLDFSIDQQKRSIGAFQSWAVNFREQLAQYEHNPYRFNNAAGGGMSLSNMSAFKIRTEPDGGFQAGSIQADMSGTGWMCKRLDDSWTEFPDIAELALNFLRDAGIGPGLTDEAFDLAIWQEFSDYCRANVANTQTPPIIDSPGDDETIGNGPDEGENPSPVNPRFVFIKSDRTDGREFIGGTFEVTEPGKEQTRRVVDVVPRRCLEKYVRDTAIIGDGHGWIVKDDLAGSPGFFAVIDQPWEGGKIPQRNDAFRMSGGAASVPRFMANGVILTEETTVGQALEKSILLNAGGPTTSYYQNMGQIIPVWTQAEDLVVIDARKTITDTGPDRNIVRRPGQAPVKWKPFDRRRVPTTLIVSFPDQARRFETSSIPIKNRRAELRLKNDFGIGLRDRREMELSTPLLKSADEALRAGSKALREHGFLEQGGFLRTLGDFEFEMPVHDAIEMIPRRDVYPASFLGLPANFGYIRIWSKEESPERLTFKITARPHVQSIYDDTARDVLLNRYPEGDAASSDYPDPVDIASVTPDEIVDVDQSVLEVLDVEIDLPAEES